MSKKVDKKLLLNHVKHAGSHNKLHEEKDMWQQREREKKKEREKDDWSIRASVTADPSLVRRHLVSDTLHYSDTPTPSPSPPSHSYYSEELQHKSKRLTESNYWTRELMKVEEADPYRWGHSGYKEQHPEEFVSSDEGSDAKEKKPKLKKKKKKKKVVESGTKKKHKRGSGTGRKIRKRRKKSEDCRSDSELHSSSSSTSVDSEEYRKRRKGRRDKRKAKEKK